MLNTYKGNVYPCFYERAGIKQEEDYKTNHTREIEKNNCWSSHAICMEGESDTDKSTYELSSDPHMHLIHLIS